MFYFLAILHKPSFSGILFLPLILFFSVPRHLWVLIIVFVFCVYACFSRMFFIYLSTIFNSSLTVRYSIFHQFYVGTLFWLSVFLRRPYWRCYFPGTNCIIFVVDSADVERLSIAKKVDFGRFLWRNFTLLSHTSIFINHFVLSCTRN